jgi:hypothetical protein
MTEPFWVLYDEVTDAIREEIKERDFDNEQREFLEFLVAGFFKEYEQWTRETWTDRYLALFKHRAPYRALHLIGQAYLHIAYDLPRVLADFQHHYDPDLDEAYLALQPALERALRRCANKRRAFGRFAILAYLPFKNQLYGTLLYWVVALRSVALAHGRMLNSMPPIRRRKYERKIRRAVRSSAQHALEHAYIPTGWLAALKPPVLMLAVFPFTITFTVEERHVIILVAVLAVLFVLRILTLQRHLIGFAQVFGQDLVQRLRRINPESGPSLPRSRA